MKQLLLLFSFLLIGGLAYNQTVLEDFEDGGKLGWNPEFGDGTFSIVDNPAVADTTLDVLGINRTAKVGSYVKEEGKAFSLLISPLDAPLDLTTNNKFTLQIHAPVATSVLFKLEGTGENYEVRKNIAITNTWIEYEFDMSGASAMTTIDKIIIFFDPGVGESSDTYLFDNITVGPADACAGTMPVDGLVDDFECQRFVSVGNPGYRDLEAVANPDPTGINTSANVGQYNDSNGGAWHALVYDYGASGIPLAELNVMKLKVWAPTAGRLLVKLEAGTSPNVERDAQITELNQWVEYTIDFSDLANANYTKLVFFFNAGEEPGENDIYYIDDIRWEAPVLGEAIEDFEDGGKLTWGPLNDDSALHGTFSIIANPAMMGNESANIGSYTKGTTAFSTLSAILTNGLDLSQFSQLNLQVWAPAGATTVTMQLVSATQGNKSVTRDITTTEAWTEINFNFEEFKSITDFFQLNLLFDEGMASSGTTYFIDNLSIGAGTVDPCEGVEADPTVVDDFDCQRNTNITVGAELLQAVDNPDPTGINADPLDKVGEYVDPFDEWSAIVYNFGGPIDLSVRNQLVVKIWSPAAVPLLFKLEGGADPVFEEFVDVAITNAWVEYVVDLSEAAGRDHPSLAIFFNAGQIQPEQYTYYIDDVAFRRAPLTSCVADFESNALQLTEWTYFPENDDNPGFGFIANPGKSDLNPSDTVGYHLEKGNGTQPWAGMFTDLEAPVSLPNDNKVITMKVWADHAATIVMKLEQGRDVPSTGDTPADYTTPGEWQELTFDFTTSPNPVPDDALYDRLTLIFDIENIPTEDKEYYFDDIAIGSTSCSSSTGIFSPLVVETIQIAPNPVRNQLMISNTNGIAHFEVYSPLGERLQVYQTTGQNSLELNVADLPKGMYILTGFDKKGALVGNAKFIKQ